MTGRAAIPAEQREAIKARAARIPIVGTIGIVVNALWDGGCEVRAPRRESYGGVFDSYNGGFLAAVADTAACLTVLTRAGAEARVATTDISIRFLAPCLTDVTAIGEIIKAGRTLSPVAVDLFDASGNRVAVAQVTYFVLDRQHGWHEN